MPPSYGFWLDPMTGQFHAVITHQDWILDHAAEIGVADQVVGLDALRDEDRIRIIGCQAGLVRIRDYGRRMSVQFWTEEKDRVAGVVRAIQVLLPKIGVGPLKSIWLNNLATGDQTTLLAEDFFQISDLFQKGT